MAALTPVVLDLSHHNDIYPKDGWARMKAAGVQGVILKCTQGVKYADATYASRRKAAQAAGLLVGAYHFATNADPHAQANFFLATSKPDDRLLLALDWEDNPDGPNMSLMQARQFLDAVMSATGRDPAHIVLYSGNVLKEAIAAGNGADAVYFKRFPLWLCQYGPKAVVPHGWPGYWLWQFSETYQSAALKLAVGGHVDANVFGGSDLATEWAPGCAAVAITKPAPPPVPAPVAVAPTPPKPPEAAEVPEPASETADEPATPVKAGFFSDWSFMRINDLADQGSRVAEKIRDVKQTFWKGGTVVAGGAAAASQYVDTSKGTGAVAASWASQHPFLLLLGGISVVVLVFYIAIKAIERYLLTAHADGRYSPRGG